MKWWSKFFSFFLSIKAFMFSGLRSFSPLFSIDFNCFFAFIACSITQETISISNLGTCGAPILPLHSCHKRGIACITFTILWFHGYSMGVCCHCVNTKHGKLGGLSMRKIAMKISVTLGIIVLSLLAGLPPADAINWTFTDNVTVQGAGGLTTPVVALPGGDVQNQIDAKQAADADLATLSDLGNWKFIYSNGSSNIVAGAFGANGTVLCFTGTASAPTPCTPTFTAPGSDTHMIFNDVGVPGANSGFTYNKTLKNAYLDNTFRAAAYETTQSATVAGYFRMYELSGNGSNYIGFTVPDAITATYSLKLPDATPNSEILNCAAPSGGVSACSWSSGGTASAITYGTAPVVEDRKSVV